MKDNIICGGVNSIKRFIYCQKDNPSLTPVYFSDFRAKETDSEKAAKDFTDKVAIKQRGKTKEYFEFFM